MKIVRISILAFVAGLALAAQVPGGPGLSGSVASVSASGLSLVTADGTTKKVVFAPEMRITESQSVRYDAIKVGDYLGVAAKKAADGSLSAVVINIFPAAFASQVRTAQFDMPDGNVMTNAEVTQFAASVGGHTLSMKYGNSMATIAVPDDVVVHRLLVLSKSDLKVNLKVTIRGKDGADGSFLANGIAIVM